MSIFLMFIYTYWNVTKICLIISGTFSILGYEKNTIVKCYVNIIISYLFKVQSIQS